LIAISPLMCLILAATPSTGGTAGTQDPIGVWKGLAQGDGPRVPPGGFPVSLFLSETPAGTRVQFQLQGTDLPEADVSFDPKTSVLEFETTVRGAPFELRATLAGDELKGTCSGMGMTLAVQAHRIAHEVLDAPQAPSAPVDLARLTTKAWAEDLGLLAAYLPQVHVNAYHTVSAEEWQATVDEVAAGLPEWNGLEASLALARLVARVGDAHTGLNWREIPGFASFPIRLEFFADGLFVTAVDERWADALGLKVVKIGSQPTDDALAAVARLFAAENDSWVHAQARSMLSIPKLLAILGVVPSSERLPIVVEVSPGEEFAFEIEAQGDGTLLRVPDPNYDTVPLWRTRTSKYYWFTALPDDGAVYFAYNSCQEDPASPMQGFVSEVLEAVELTLAERLIIDLRNNSGGNSNVLSSQMERLASHPRLSEPGRIIALIGHERAPVA